MAQSTPDFLWECMNLARTPGKTEKAVPTGHPVGETIMNKSNSTEQKPTMVSNELVPVAAGKLMDGIAPGSKWSKTNVAGAEPADAAQDTQDRPALLDPATLARLKQAGHLSCPLCQRSGPTVKVVDVRPGKPPGYTEYLMECDFDPHAWIVSVPDKKRLF